MSASSPRRNKPVPRLHPMSFFSIGNSGSPGALSISRRISICDMTLSILCWSAGQRRLHAMKEQPGDNKAEPDNEAKQAHNIDRSQYADAVLPKLAEVRHQPDREKGEYKENDSIGVCLTYGRR